MAKLRWALGAGAIVGLAGCATFGGNVKGNFRCEAPAGICAPTSKIDDQALALISEGSPPGGALTAGATLPAAGRRVPASAQAPHSPRALKIVLPARQDRYGRWREPTIVYAELDEEGPAVLTGGGEPSARAARVSLAELAAGAPELPALKATSPAPAAKPATREEIAEAVRQRLQAGNGGAAPAAVPPAASVPAGSGKAPAPVATSVQAPSFPASQAAQER